MKFHKNMIIQHLTIYLHTNGFRMQDTVNHFGIANPLVSNDKWCIFYSAFNKGLLKGSKSIRLESLMAPKLKSLNTYLLPMPKLEGSKAFEYSKARKLEVLKALWPKSLNTQKLDGPKAQKFKYSKARGPESIEYLKARKLEGSKARRLKSSRAQRLEGSKTQGLISSNAWGPERSKV